MLLIFAVVTSAREISSTGSLFFKVVEDLLVHFLSSFLHVAV
ncbi:hypothetical protein NT05LM_2125 [Listeria marthii FSL S4-120]|uniref:Uncharacterized protein n=1 Tax=Listeria marthii FSL S4-120 TaxID=702457 RepID=A0ABP2JZ95_9LIST|nr:hypothetical protein NT05LM_2125 [Listeria marthii FSL S4-120]